MLTTSKDGLESVKKYAGCMLMGLAGMVFASASVGQELPDFSGVWQMADFELTKRPDENNPKFTEQAKKQLEDYKARFDPVEDDPALFCVQKGMPWSITSRARTYPTEIYQTQNTIFIFFEYHDNHRLIHLDKKTMPKRYAPSSEGYSIGHWEGDTLVVETRGLAAHHPVGPLMRSEEAKITERWKLTNHPEHGEVIDISLVVEDPEVYLEPAKGRQVFKRAEEGVVVGGYNCNYDVWDKHVSEREQ